MATTGGLVVGLGGYIGAGKSSVANLLQQEVGSVTMSFADGVRECLSTLNPFVDCGVQWNAAMAIHGYADARREYPEMRRLMQVFATEVVRERFGRDTWTRLTLERCQELLASGTSIVVIDDVRFENEIEAIEALDGITIWIDRDGVEPSEHASEQLDMNRCDFVVKNTDLDACAKDVAEILRLFAPPGFH